MFVKVERETETEIRYRKYDGRKVCLNYAGRDAGSLN